MPTGRLAHRPPRHPRQSARPLLARALSTVRDGAGRDRIELVPLRAFIGLGWLRAASEKAPDPGWWDGTVLAAFLERQAVTGAIPFPAYEAVARAVFVPASAPLGWVIVFGQALAGLAILTGTLTNAALLGGLFMNLNFLLAGVPDPSAFYLVIQGALLVANAGAVLGVDARLGLGARHPFLAARPPSAATSPALGRPVLAALVALSLGVVGYALSHVQRWDPAGSVHDPAVILAVLAAMAASWSTIVLLRHFPAVGPEPPPPFEGFAWAAWDTAAWDAATRDVSAPAAPPSPPAWPGDGPPRRDATWVTDVPPDPASAGPTRPPRGGPAIRRNPLRPLQTGGTLGAPRPAGHLDRRRPAAPHAVRDPADHAP